MTWTCVNTVSLRGGGIHKDDTPHVTAQCPLKLAYLQLITSAIQRLDVLLADGADKAGRVVGLAQGSDHFPLHKVPTAIAAGAVHALIIQCAQILSILHEEAPLGQIAAAHYTGHTHTLALRSFSVLPI